MTYRLRPYAPKPLDPGQPFDALGLHGVVWSEGPEANSRWVLCDDGETVAVKLTPQGVPRRRLRDYDDWRERMARVLASPWLSSEHRRVV